MATTPKDRLNRLGQPSLALPLVVVAFVTVLGIALLITLPGTSAPEAAHAPAAFEPASRTV